MGLLVFAAELTPGRAASLVIEYAAYLLLVAYLMTVVAGLVLVLRTDRKIIPIAVLAGGTVVLGYIIYRTFVPLPDAPFDRLVIAAGLSLALGIALVAVPRVRRAMHDSLTLTALGVFSDVDTSQSVWGRSGSLPPTKRPEPHLRSASIKLANTAALPSSPLQTRLSSPRS